MDGIKKYDEYVKDKKLFRKKIRECTNADKLYEFLREIAESNMVLGSNFTYKLLCKNTRNLPFEDVAIVGNLIVGYFYLQGSRTYRSIIEFSYNVFLIKYDHYSRSFSVNKQ